MHLTVPTTKNNAAEAEKPWTIHMGHIPPALFPLNYTPFATILPYLPKEKKAILKQMSTISKADAITTITIDAPNPSADLYFTVLKNVF